MGLLEKDLLTGKVGWILSQDVYCSIIKSQRPVIFEKRSINEVLRNLLLLDWIYEVLQYTDLL